MTLASLNSPVTGVTGAAECGRADLILTRFLAPGAVAVPQRILSFFQGTMDSGLRQAHSVF
jgi:hypothetical protein